MSFALMLAALLVTVVIAILTIVVSVSDGVRWTIEVWERWFGRSEGEGSD